ncbi:SDR family oxidoreductase [Micromonospora sp. URMC 105]|uniref:SDR family oxidoreductase n=1 Tax=Micromonospora sp. URMC 105 TaxID=3423413 RepID=UPI003F1AF311
MDIKNKTAIVAGATSGLGLAVAEELSAQGANVVILGRRGRLAQEIAGRLDNALGLECDIADADAVRDAFARTLERFGALHLNVNTAAVIAPVPVVQPDGTPTPIADFQRLIDINLVGTFNVMTNAVAAILRNEPDSNGERGVVINTSSISAHEGHAGHAGYAATKAALIGMTLPAARDLLGKGVRVNTIVAGGFRTPILDGYIDDEMERGISAQIPNPQRLGHPEEFARFVTHMINNQYFNAATPRLDGGYRLPVQQY